MMIRQRPTAGFGVARAGTSTFEVQIYKQDHWVLDRRVETEEEARTCGKALLNGRAEGIRIVKDWVRSDGRHVETEIHTEFRARSTAITITPIDEPPPVCESEDDFYSINARMVMGRLLRNYVERLVITPTEILHHYPELKRLLDKDNLMPTAVGRIAAMQAEKIGMDGRVRRDELYDIVNTLTERARVAGTRKDLPDIAVGGLNAAMDKLAREPERDRDFLAKVVLSRDLVQTRNWIGKLDYLTELAREDGGLTDAPLALVDGAIADVFGAPSVAQELLGEQRNLATALCNLIDLSRGRYHPTDRGGEDRSVQLNELLAFHDLDQTRLMVVDLVRRQLKGTQPLHRADPEAEKDAFREVLHRAITPNGVVGGPAVAEALIQRYARFLEQGGATGRRQAMAEVLACLPDGKDRVRFLIALIGSEMGRGHRDDIGGLLTQTTSEVARFRFVDSTQPIKNNLEGLTTLYGQVLDSAVPEPLRSTLADSLDDMLVGYIQNSRVVERLDNPGDILRHRANRLIQLCAPGTLQSRKALSMVRQRVVNHLRQPNFEERYVEDINDPLLRAKALRDFYLLLGQAGFR